MTVINSVNNPTIKLLKKLNSSSKSRKKEGLYIVEGIKPVNELKKDRIYKLIVSEDFDLTNITLDLNQLNITIITVSKNLFKEVSNEKTPQGVIAIVYIKKYDIEEIFREKEKNPLYIILDSLQDPGNLGTIIRVADAINATGIIVNKSTVDLYNPKVVRATMGSIERVAFYVSENLVETIKSMKNIGISIYGAYLDESIYYYNNSYKKATAFVIGNEGNGISDSVIKEVSSRVKIPILGNCESLNAAIAASILMYEVVRQRADQN